jgi:hypothetical protein
MRWTRRIATIGISLGLLAVSTLATASYVDFFYVLQPFGFDTDQIVEVPGTASTSASLVQSFPIVTPTPGGPTDAYSYYLDAWSSYARVGEGLPYDGTASPPAPQHRSRVLLDVTRFTNPPGTPPPPLVAATGSRFLQDVTVNHQLGQTTALVQLAWDVDLDILLTVPPGTANVWEGSFGFQLIPPVGGPQNFSGFILADGFMDLPDGLTAQDLGGGHYRVTGTLLSSPFGVATGTPIVVDSTFYTQAYMETRPTPGIYSGTIEVDGGDTVEPRLVSSDPNVSFELPTPAPEPAATLLAAAAIAVLVERLRRRPR